MQALSSKPGPRKIEDAALVKQATMASTTRPDRLSVACQHSPPASFRAGETVPIVLSFDHGPVSDRPSAARLHYRRVNQAERWDSIEMEKNQTGFSAAIPATYSKSVYPLQYYFEFRRGQHLAWLYPGLHAELANQPYFLIQMA
jgi:hypothetical protein